MRSREDQHQGHQHQDHQKTGKDRPRARPLMPETPNAANQVKEAEAPRHQPETQGRAPGLGHHQDGDGEGKPQDPEGPADDGAFLAAQPEPQDGSPKQHQTGEHNGDNEPETKGRVAEVIAQSTQHLPEQRPVRLTQHTDHQANGRGG